MYTRYILTDFLTRWGFMCMLIFIDLSYSQEAESLINSTSCAGKPFVIEFDPKRSNVSATGIIKWYIDVGNKRDPLAVHTTGGKILTVFVERYKNRLSVNDEYFLKVDHLQKEDEGIYVAEINDSVSRTKLFLKNKLIVKDPCLVITKTQVDMKECDLAICYTSTGGYFMKDEQNLTSLNATVCKESNSGNYSCCPPSGQKCQSSFIESKKTKTGNDKTVLVVVFVLIAVVAVGVGIAVALYCRRKREKSGGEGYALANRSDTRT